MKPVMNRILCLSAAGLLAGCSLLTPVPAWKAAVAGDGPGEMSRVQMEEPLVQNLPRSRHGNSREYTVFGQSYRTLDTARDFTETGIASWYGSKFHGRLTASGEPYDMHQLTAAHKHLPLPTFVRVTRLDDGRSVVVKVNDRGPFVGERIIDLSYAAAAMLGMVEGGKAEVFVEALSSDAAPAGPDLVAGGVPDAGPPIISPALSPALSPAIQVVQYLQVGAYSQVTNAHAMLDKLQHQLSMPAAVERDSAGQLYRVLIGPFADPVQMQRTLDSLALAGIADHTFRSANP